MDALTKGLKKVTLKLGTREEPDRKMKEKLDSERRARALKGAETRRINKAARDAELNKSKLTPAQRAKLGPDAASVPESNKSKLVPAQKTKIVPDAARTAEVNAIPSVETTTSNILTTAPSLPPVLVASNEVPGMSSAGGSDQLTFPQQIQQHSDSFDHSAEQNYRSTTEKLHNEPEREKKNTAPIEQPAQQTQYGIPVSAAIAGAVPASATEPAPHFSIPTYEAPALSAMPAPTTAPAPAPVSLPTHSPTANTFFNPSYAPQQPPTHSRQSSSSNHRFVPVMDDTTPPSSRPSSSARGASYQPSPAGSVQKQSPPESNATDRQLPVFSATGRIPFASSSPAAETGAAAQQVVGGGSRLKDEMEMDGDGDVGMGGGGWEVPESPEK
jgi:histone deacetylase HOS3